MQTSTAPTSKEYTREYLKTLDEDEIITIALQEHSKAKQYAASICRLMFEKYGPKNERHVSDGQVLFFPDLISGAKSSTDTPSDNIENVPPEAPPANGDEQPKAKTKQPGHNRKAMPEGLPRVTTVAPLPEGTAFPCSCCGNSKIVVRTILQASRYQVIPGYFYIEDLHSAILGCPTCQEKEPTEVIRATEVGPNSLASPSLLARIAVSRDNDHQPYYRLSQIFERTGVELPRSTLSDMVALTVKILQPLYDYMKGLVNQAKIISTDDTPVKILDRENAKNIKTGRMWIYFGSKNQPISILDATSGRGRDGPLKFLKDFKGRLQGDCFSGNYAICAAKDTILVACMAHARRYFVKAKLNNKAGANEALDMFYDLYEVEKTAKEQGLSYNEFKLLREKDSKPILDKLYQWIIEQQSKTKDPKSAFGKALFYFKNNWNSLMQYLEDGELSIDNNHAEREMKYIAMGRKNWLFCGSDKGAKDHAVILSMLATCRRHGINPEAYLTDVIQRLAENPKENLEDLLPYKWKQKYCLRGAAEITGLLPTPKAA